MSLRLEEGKEKGTSHWVGRKLGVSDCLARPGHDAGLGLGLGSEEVVQVKDVGRCWWHDTDTRLRCGPSESAISVS